MRTFCLFILSAVSSLTFAQVTINPSVEFISSPTFGGGHLLRPLLTYSFSGNVMSPGIKIEKKFFTDSTNGTSLSWSTGLYYFKANIVGIKTAGSNEFYSEINYQYINIPLILRGSVNSSPLFESSKVNFEFGVQNSVWMDYKLSEAASIKTVDDMNNVTSENVYTSDNKLISKFGNKYTLSVLAGFGASFKRFDFMIRYTFSVSDYSATLPARPQFPSDYSLYVQERKMGRFKQQYFSAVISCRLF